MIVIKLFSTFEVFEDLGPEFLTKEGYITFDKLDAKPYSKP